MKGVCIVVENIALLAGSQRDWKKLSTVCSNCTHVLSSTYLYAIFHMQNVFGPPCIFPRGDRRWGPIFSNYRAPLVIITTNQLVANFVKVHQYFTWTIIVYMLILGLPVVYGHFEPKTLRHQTHGAEVSQIFALVPECHWTLRHQCWNVLDTSALNCMRHFGPRTKRCLECRHCLKKCRPNLCYSNIMDRVLGND